MESDNCLSSLSRRTQAKRAIANYGLYLLRARCRHPAPSEHNKIPSLERSVPASPDIRICSYESSQTSTWDVRWREFPLQTYILISSSRGGTTVQRYKEAETSEFSASHEPPVRSELLPTLCFEGIPVGHEGLVTCEAFLERTTLGEHTEGSIIAWLHPKGFEDHAKRSRLDGCEKDEALE